MRPGTSGNVCFSSTRLEPADLLDFLQVLQSTLQAIHQARGHLRQDAVHVAQARDNIVP